VGDGLVIPVPDEGLGNSAYLVDLGGGRALAVDPPRDLRALDAEASSRGLAVAVTAETHLHADFLSGSTRLAARDGAAVLASAAGRRELPHTALADGDEADLGGLTARAWATPGHTPEHLAYLLCDGGRVLAVFTGGSLIVGAAARTDLVSREVTEPLAHDQFRSLRRLTTLPDETPVYPTHGAGSFCAAAPGTSRTTTIGREKVANPLLQIDDEDSFVAALLAGTGSFPPYFHRLAELNRRGPSVPAADPVLAPLTVAQVRDLRGAGAELIDVRPADDYAAGHIPGVLAIPLRGAFATWLGWLIPDPGTALVIVRGSAQDATEIIWQALKIGYDNLAGELAGGMAAWTSAGQPVRATPRYRPGTIHPHQVMDVRQASEYVSGHLPAAENIELGSLPGAHLPRGPVTVMCERGDRATTAASVLERAGLRDITVLAGGPREWARAADQPLEIS
jgi:hydroxyacylglutathione hydrolase